MGNNGGGSYHRWTPDEIREVLRSRNNLNLTIEQIVRNFARHWGFSPTKDSVAGVYKKYSKDDRYKGPEYTALDTSSDSSKTPTPPDKTMPTVNVPQTASTAIEAGNGVATAHAANGNMLGNAPTGLGQGNSHYHPRHTIIFPFGTGRFFRVTVNEDRTPLVIGHDANGNEIYEIEEIVDGEELDNDDN
ncbi:MAG: hypothetical protein M1836_001573 [Candelina mexicana]|nr:MAG: hypothetical protein M1836_001573 [Candelina mexicana]